jgi:hypothetical protein
VYGFCLLLGILFLPVGMLAIALQTPALALLSWLFTLLFLLIAYRLGQTRKAQALAAAGADLQGQLDKLRQGGGLVPLHLPCKAKLPWALSLGALLYLTLPSWLRQPSWGFGLFVLALIVIEAIFLYKLIVEWGDGKLQLSEDGIGGCGWGFIPWQAVDSVGLIDSSYSARGHRTYMTLMAFVIPDIRPHLAQIHWLRRIYWHLSGGRPQVKMAFNLKRNSPPDLIKELARELWTRKTGMTHHYSPGQSASFNQSLREDDRLLREMRGRHDEELKMLEEVNRLADSDEKAAEALLTKLQARDRTSVKDASERMALHAKERQTQLLRQSYWVLCGIIVLIAAFFLIPAMTR